MIFYFIIVGFYTVLLILVKPAPSSLKAPSISYLENFKSVKGTIFVVFFILSIFLYVSDFSFNIVNEKRYSALALYNYMDTTAQLPQRALQGITHLFVHAGLAHLLANTMGLAILSLYERRVGTKRYFSVLCISSIASISSVFLYPEHTSACGLSGGVFGLATAYFTDEKRLSFTEWLQSIMLFAFIVFAMSISGLGSTHAEIDVKIDYFAHVLGVVAALIYCRNFPQK